MNFQDTNTVVVVSVFGAAVLLLLVIVIVLLVQVSVLRRLMRDVQTSSRLRIQKLKMNSDKNHAFHNPTISPNEELSRRGYSMYQGNDTDVETGRGTERQTGGQFVEELTREIDSRQQRQNAPPFLLHSIDDNKRKSMGLNNPVASGRQSDTNPNFIY